MKSNILGQTAYDIASFWNHHAVMHILKPSDSDKTAQEPVHFFTVKNLDRDSSKRKDSALLRQTLTTLPTARLLVLVNGFPVLTQADDKYSLRLFKYTELANFIDVDNFDTSGIVYLGKRIVDDGTDGSVLFAVNLNQGMSTFVVTQLQVCNLIQFN